MTEHLHLYFSLPTCFDHKALYYLFERQNRHGRHRLIGVF